MPLQRIISNTLKDDAVTQSKIADNTVNISKLDVTDGTAGQVLSTDGNGGLLFIDAGTGSGSGSGSGVTGCDDPNTVLLIHSDTTNGSTFFDDSSSNDHGLNINGNLQHSTTQNKIGVSSIQFDGVGATRLNINPANLSNLGFIGTGSFTVEGWIFHLSTQNDANTVDRIFNAGAGGNGDELINLDYDGTNGILRAMASTVGGASGVRDIFDGSTTNHGITDNAWHHIAYVRNGNNFNVYVDGVSRLSGSSSSAIGNATEFAFGGYSNGFDGGAGDVPSSWNGFMDELRISNVARYTSNFTPQTTEFCPGGDSSGDFVEGSGGGNQTVSPFGPSQSGYSLGGTVTGDQHFSSRVDKFAYSSGSNATTVADMPATRGKSQAGACTSSTAAYQCAGYIRDINDNNQGDGGTLKNSDALTRVTFSSDALSFELTNLSVGQRATAGVSSSTDGYVGGGFQDPSGSVRKFSFANETSQSNPHNMTKGRSSFFGVQSGTHGYWGGGSNAVGFAPQNTPNFEKFAFASDGSSALVAGIAPNQGSAGCLSSEFQGWFRQGTTLFELTFASDSNSVNTLGNPPEEVLRGASRNGSYFTAGEGWSHGGQSEIDETSTANGVFAISATSNKFSILSGNEASQQGDLTIARIGSTAHGF